MADIEAEINEEVGLADVFEIDSTARETLEEVGLADSFEVVVHSWSQAARRREQLPVVGGGGPWEYGRKPYIYGDSDDYWDMLHRMPARAFYQRSPEKESEFKKPYLEDNYQEMEHFYSDPYTPPRPFPPPIPPPEPPEEDECDYADEFLWDDIDSAETMGPTDTAEVFVLGGVGDFLWDITGDGFYFDASHTEKELVTSARFATVYSLSASGFCEITVTDACGMQVMGGIRCTNGSWYIYCDSNIYPDYADADVRYCCWHMGLGEWIGHISNSDYYELFFAGGQAKQWQQSTRVRRCGLMDADDAICDVGVDEACGPAPYGLDGTPGVNCSQWPPMGIENCIDPELEDPDFPLEPPPAEYVHELWCYPGEDEVFGFPYWQIECIVVYRMKVEYWS